MPFFPTVDVAAIVRDRDLLEMKAGRFPGFGDESDVSRIPVTEVRVGDAHYFLREQTTGVFIPNPTAGQSEFRVRGFPGFVGRGSTLADAMDSWQSEVHTAVQQLLSKRPFEMTPEQTSRWIVLLKEIDIAKYRNSESLKTRQFGRVRFNPDTGWCLAWENGTENRITLDQVPPNFPATLNAGQRFEAIAVYDRMTMKFIRVDYIVPASSNQLSPKQRRDLWDGLNTTSELPDADLE